MRNQVLIIVLLASIFAGCRQERETEIHAYNIRPGVCEGKLKDCVLRCPAHTPTNYIPMNYGSQFFDFNPDKVFKLYHEKTFIRSTYTLSVRTGVHLHFKNLLTGKDDVLALNRETSNYKLSDCYQDKTWSKHDQNR